MKSLQVELWLLEYLALVVPSGSLLSWALLSQENRRMQKRKTLLNKRVVVGRHEKTDGAGHGGPASWETCCGCAELILAPSEMTLNVP